MANDLTRMAKKVKRLPRKLKSAQDSEIEDEMQSMARSAQANLVSSRTVASGELAASTRHHDYSERKQFRGFATHAVSARTKYARFVEYGTGYYSQNGYKAPSRPPLDNIVAWITEKGITPRVYDSVYALAKAIQMVIAIFGNRPHPFMRPAWQQHRPQLSQAHKRGVRRALRRL